MSLKLDDVGRLQEYLAGVVNRADHHADNVRYVVLPLIGAIILFKNPKRKIEVLTQAGETKNVLWVHIGDSRYAFTYNHRTKRILMKRKTTQGPIVGRFTNATTIQEILSIFEAL